MPTEADSMYRWRSWTPDQRKQVLDERSQRSHPRHSPAHIESDLTTYYLVTAACFEHKPIIGHSEDRLASFSNQLMERLDANCHQVFAWAVLPNHYHALVDTCELKTLFAEIGRFHGRHSFIWNGEDSKRGRQVWCKAAETAMKSEGHFYASINYVLNNPVHHGYCKKWTDWPFSSVGEYLESIGREVAMNRWRSYPVYEYGQNWDPPEL